MSDYTWKRIGDIKTTDEVMGLDFTNPGSSAKFVSTRVTNVTSSIKSNMVEVQAGDNTIICTSDHKFYNVTWGQHWTEAKSMDSKIVKTLPVYELSDEFWEGWLHGIIVGDGWFHKFKQHWLRFGIACKDEEILQKVYELLTKKGMHPHWQTHNVSYSGTRVNMNAIELTRSLEAEELFEEVNDNRYHDTLVDRTIDGMRGYLAGIVDAEGYINQGVDIRISQKDINVVNQICDYLDQLGFPYTVRHDRENLYTIIVQGLTKFNCVCRPLLERKRQSNTIRALHDRHQCFVSPRLGTSEVIDISTTVGNFICEGFIVHNCDTKYSWKYYVDIPTDKVADSIRRSQTAFLVITGGEPTLQLIDIYEVLDLLERNGRKPFTTLETNGTKEVDTDKFDLIMVSPKSFEDADPWWEVDNAYLKFVVDYDSIDATLDYISSHHIKKPVYLMPQSLTVDEMIENSLLIIYKIQEGNLENILLCPRLQLLYGVK